MSETDYSDYSDYSATGSGDDYSGVTSVTGSYSDDDLSARSGGSSSSGKAARQTAAPKPRFPNDPYVAEEPKAAPAQAAPTAGAAGGKVRSRSASKGAALAAPRRVAKVGNPVRKCQDVIFLVLFLASWVGMFFVAGFAFDRGDPERIYFPMDSQGNFCGKDNVQEGYSHIVATQRKDFTDAKFLYYMDPSDASINRCVSACPTETSSNAACLALTPSTAAALGSTTATAGCVCPYTDATNGSKCYPQYASTAAARRCVPGNLDDDSVAAIKSELERFNGFFERFFSVGGEDSGEGWKSIAAAFGIAVGLSLVFMAVMWVAAPIMVWGLITVGYAALIAGCVWLVIKGRDWTDDANAAEPTNDNDVRNAEALVVTSYVAVGFTFLLGVVILFMAKRINLAIAVIRVASKSCGANPSVFFSPIISCILVGGVVAWSLYVGAYLYSAGEITIVNGFQREFNHDRELQGVIVYHAFWAAWVVFFLLGLSSLSVALVASQYYFKVPQPMCGAYFAALGKSLLYHLGSIAFGSLLIAIVFAIRVALQFVKKQMKSYIESVPGAKLAVCCVECCLACFQRFLEFLTTNAYIQIAINGYSFCAAAKAASKLIVNNPLRVAAVTGVSTLVLFVGKVIVAAGTVLIVQEAILEEQGVERNYIIMFLIFIFAYCVAYVVFTTYESTIKAILHCAVEDERWHKPGERFAPPYLASKLLPREKPPKQA
eukprot:TRINITY_DN553_c0_g1_i1.p1 TRINITY_DN553_c0_g1~~TRINITY_DN553_c0_g1_i1.p1  ORF type:complete len:716 (+),score=391.80 TRINITY_DN553_c0_g1_i1:211-2358(+)